MPFWRRCRRETRGRRRGKGRREEGGEKRERGKRRKSGCFCLSRPLFWVSTCHFGHKNSSTKLHFREPPIPATFALFFKGVQKIFSEPPGWDPNQRRGFAPPKPQPSASSGSSVRAHGARASVVSFDDLSRVTSCCTKVCTVYHVDSRPLNIS